MKAKKIKRYEKSKECNQFFVNIVNKDYTIFTYHSNKALNSKILIKFLIFKMKNKFKTSNGQ